MILYSLERSLFIACRCISNSTTRTCSLRGENAIYQHIDSYNDAFGDNKCGEGQSSMLKCAWYNHWIGFRWLKWCLVKVVQIPMVSLASLLSKRASTHTWIVLPRSYVSGIARFHWTASFPSSAISDRCSTRVCMCRASWNNAGTFHNVHILKWLLISPKTHDRSCWTNGLFERWHHDIVSDKELSRSKLRTGLSSQWSGTENGYF